MLRKRIADTSNTAIMVTLGEGTENERVRRLGTIESAITIEEGDGGFSPLTKSFIEENVDASYSCHDSEKNYYDPSVVMDMVAKEIERVENSEIEIAPKHYLSLKRDLEAICFIADSFLDYIIL